MSKVAFLGLGNMGGPMAANLVKASYAVTGFDLMEAQKQAAAASGLTIAQSARDAVAGADVIVTMLPAGRHVLASWADFLPVASKGALAIDCSTIDVESARRAHEAGAAAGALTLDAPVSGGVGGATAATLTFMCGGSPEAFDRAKPILEAMGKRIVHCGGPGAGQTAKICNNMILGATMIATCEAFVGPVLVVDELLPGAGSGAHVARQSRLQTGVRRQPDAEGSAACAGGRGRRRGGDTARGCGRADLCPVRGGVPWRGRLFRRDQFSARFAVRQGGSGRLSFR